MQKKAAIINKDNTGTAINTDKERIKEILGSPVDSGEGE